MIGRLTGVLVEDDGDGTIVLDVNGVGYEVVTPLGAVGRARALGDGERLTFHVHTHVREDTLALYGFATLQDRAVFRLLIGLPNVGPKLALAILSALPANELAVAVAREDRARLSTIPGVGKKTVERLLVELKGRLAPGPASKAAPTLPLPQVTPSTPSKSEQLTSALAHLGFRPAQVDRALDALREKIDTEPLPDLIRQALALLTR